jgi:hypothetical protein
MAKRTIRFTAAQDDNLRTLKSRISGQIREAYGEQIMELSKEEAVGMIHKGEARFKIEEAFRADGSCARGLTTVISMFSFPGDDARGEHNQVVGYKRDKAVAAFTNWMDTALLDYTLCLRDAEGIRDQILKVREAAMSGDPAKLQEAIEALN